MRTRRGKYTLTVWLAVCASGLIANEILTGDVRLVALAGWWLLAVLVAATGIKKTPACDDRGVWL